MIERKQLGIAVIVSYALPEKYPALRHAARVEVLGTEGVMILDDDPQAGWATGQRMTGSAGRYGFAAARSGKLRRDTRSVSHFTERRARSATRGGGNCT
jgi:hypothetical protein